MEKIAEGWTSEIYALSDKEVLKLYKPGFESVCQMEYDKTCYLQGVCTLVPRVFGKREEAGRPGYVMERIEGKVLGSAADGEVVQLARILFETQSLFRGLKPNELFRPASERVEHRIEAAASSLGAAGKLALEYIRSDRGAVALCHGDFHPNNVLLGETGVRLIDWNGSNIGSLESEVAKTVVLLVYAPVGLALSAEAFQQRRALCRQYVQLLRDAGVLEEANFRRWLYVRMVEFLALPVPVFHQVLRPLVFAWNEGRVLELEEWY